ncbi:MAG: agmatinase [Bacteroidetes bacterium HGW-Bacteroidetes-6]|jgi:agmatinase|nr:MAG: agmatinase [Bacteroidetes bacterium HGW-Bacteroidetes-6]
MLFSFNPDNNFSKNNGIFGLPANSDSAGIIVIPVPWDVTTSYRDGTSFAPEAILEASYQIDLFDPQLPDEWKKGVYYQHFDEWIMDLNSFERRKAKAIIDYLENNEGELPERLQRARNEVNDACRQMNKYVSEKVDLCLKSGKIPAILGGEHSISLGAVATVAKQYPGVGILQFDAHADLRNGYLGFEYSHASVMRNILNSTKEVSKLVQVGVRDLCSDEALFSNDSEKLISTYYMQLLRQRLFEGENWNKLASEIVDELPQQVYISFDIDGLDPSLCPRTGTPVPEGLLFGEVVYIMKKIVNSGRQIVGFDLTETGMDIENNWDQTVGSRLLYQLCIHTFASQK